MKSWYSRISISRTWISQILRNSKRLSESKIHSYSLISNHNLAFETFLQVQITRSANWFPLRVIWTWKYIPHSSTDRTKAVPLSSFLFYVCLTCIFNELMHYWCHVCVCMCMGVLCLRDGCVLCVAFPAWDFSHLFEISRIDYIKK